LHKKLTKETTKKPKFGHVRRLHLTMHQLVGLTG